MEGKIYQNEIRRYQVYPNGPELTSGAVIELYHDGIWEKGRVESRFQKYYFLGEKDIWLEDGMLIRVNHGRYTV